MSANPPKTAIICYSKSGHSRAMAERLAAQLHADVFALTMPRYSMPFFGYLRAGLDSLRHSFAPLDGPLPDIARYDCAVVCGPVWTSYLSVPLSTYISRQGTWPPVLGLMLTNGDHSPPQKAFAQAEAEIGQPLAAVVAIANSIEDSPEAEKKLTEFAATLRAAVTR